MLPFSSLLSSRKKSIRCRFRGGNSFGSVVCSGCVVNKIAPKAPKLPYYLKLPIFTVDTELIAFYEFNKSMLFVVVIRWMPFYFESIFQSVWKFQSEGVWKNLGS